MHSIIGRTIAAFPWLVCGLVVAPDLRSQPSVELLNEIENMERYLNQREKQFAKRLRDLVNKKDELDFHYSLNLALKAWLLVHVPLTYGLLILAALHLVVVYAFGGGVG